MTMKENKKAYDDIFNRMKTDKDNEDLYLEAIEILEKNSERLHAGKEPIWWDIVKEFKKVKQFNKKEKNYFCHSCGVEVKTTRNIEGKTCLCGEGVILRGYFIK